MKREYSQQNVYDALQDRLKFIFEEFDNIYLSFSGGKDSGLLLNLVLDYQQKMCIRDRENPSYDNGNYHRNFCRGCHTFFDSSILFCSQILSYKGGCSISERYCCQFKQTIQFIRSSKPSHIKESKTIYHILNHNASKTNNHILKCHWKS